MAKKANQKVEINVDELNGLLTHMINNNRYIQEKGEVPVAVNIEGTAGLGKTSVVLQLANKLGLNFYKLNLAQIEELGDLVGFPIRQFQMCKDTKAILSTQKVIDGKVVTMPAITAGTECLWIDEQAVGAYDKEGYKFTGLKRMDYCPPVWIAGMQGGGILLIDDFNRADTRLIQAAMEIIDRQEYISWKLPKDWHIIMTSNPDDGKYMVNSQDDAHKTRYMTVTLKFDVECWARFAEAKGIDTRCINFLLLHPEVVKDDVNPRSVTKFFNSISSIESFEKELPLIQMIGEGTIGADFATLFTTFINNRLDKLISPKDILTKDWAYVKGALTNTVGVDKNYRADIAGILATRVINYSVVYSEKNSVDQKLIDRIAALSTEDVFSNDLKYYMFKGILNSNKSKWQKLLLNPTVAKMTYK